MDRLFAVAIHAENGTQWSMNPIAIWSQSADAAEQKCLEVAKQKYPIAHGWKNHAAIAVLCPDAKRIP